MLACPRSSPQPQLRETWPADISKTCSSKQCKGMHGSYNCQMQKAQDSISSSVRWERAALCLVPASCRVPFLPSLVSSRIFAATRHTALHCGCPWLAQRKYFALTCSGGWSACASLQSDGPSGQGSLWEDQAWISCSARPGWAEMLHQVRSRVFGYFHELEDFGTSRTG